MLRDNYITLYNIYRDRDGENENFNRTIIYVHLEEERGSEKNGTGTVSTSKDILNLFIPFCVEKETGKRFVEPEEYKKLDDKSNFFTFSSGDIVLVGNINDEIISEKEFILSHSSAKRVKRYISNNFGNYSMRYWEVYCD